MKINCAQPILKYVKTEGNVIFHPVKLLCIASVQALIKVYIENLRKFK